MGNLSRLLNRVTGGMRGETVCRRVAGRFGPSCFFCWLIGRLVRDENHCFGELDGYPAKD